MAGACVCPAGRAWNATTSVCCAAGEYVAAGVCTTCVGDLVYRGGTCQCPVGQAERVHGVCCPTSQWWDAAAPGGGACTACAPPRVVENNACVCPDGRHWDAATRTCCAATGILAGGSCQACRAPATAQRPVAGQPLQCVCPSGQAATPDGLGCCPAGERWNPAAAACDACTAPRTLRVDAANPGGVCDCPPGRVGNDATGGCCAAGEVYDTAGRACVRCTAPRTFDPAAVPPACVCPPGRAPNPVTGGCCAAGESYDPSLPAAASCTTCTAPRVVRGGQCRCPDVVLGGQTLAQAWDPVARTCEPVCPPGQHRPGGTGPCACINGGVLPDCDCQACMTEQAGVCTLPAGYELWVPAGSSIPPVCKPVCTGDCSFRDRRTGVCGPPGCPACGTCDKTDPARHVCVPGCPAATGGTCVNHVCTCPGGVPLAAGQTTCCAAGESWDGTRCVGCTLPKKVVGGVCTSCEPPRQWFGSVCRCPDAGHEFLPAAGAKLAVCLEPCVLPLVRQADRTCGCPDPAERYENGRCQPPDGSPFACSCDSGTGYRWEAPPGVWPGAAIGAGTVLCPTPGGTFENRSCHGSGLGVDYTVDAGSRGAGTVVNICEDAEMTLTRGACVPSVVRGCEATFVDWQTSESSVLEGNPLPNVHIQVFSGVDTAGSFPASPWHHNVTIGPFCGTLVPAAALGARVRLRHSRTVTGRYAVGGRLIAVCSGSLVPGNPGFWTAGNTRTTVGTTPFCRPTCPGGHSWDWGRRRCVQDRSNP